MDTFAKLLDDGWRWMAYGDDHWVGPPNAPWQKIIVPRTPEAWCALARQENPTVRIRTVDGQVLWERAP